jgi:hypothetical protein
MHTRLRKIGIGLAAVVLATVGVSVGTTSAASAASYTCGPSAPNLDSHTSQVIHPVSGYTGAAIRTGPGSNCPLLQGNIRVPWSAWVDLNCFRHGQSVSGTDTWSAVHYAQYFGWVSDYYLSNGGASFICA